MTREELQQRNDELQRAMAICTGWTKLKWTTGILRGLNPMYKDNSRARVQITPEWIYRKEHMEYLLWGMGTDECVVFHRILSGIVEHGYTWKATSEQLVEAYLRMKGCWKEEWNAQGS
jgi:hypothetical protein